MTIIRSDKRDLKTRNITREKDEYFTVEKLLVYQEYILLISIYASNISQNPWGKVNWKINR